MMSQDAQGVLHISDLLELQRSDPIFTVPADYHDDIIQQMVKQIEDDKGVAFDLRLGKQFYLSGEKATDKLDDGGHITIKPGQFALLTTYEVFHIPKNLVAFISLRFNRKAEGLINVSGFQVDPGYNGIFIFSVYNAGPREIRIPYKDKIFTILFSKTSKPVRNSIQGYDDIPMKKWDALTASKNLSVIDLDNRISSIEKWVSILKVLILTSAGAAAVLGLLAGKYIGGSG